MRLSELRVRNFRKIEDLKVIFPKGLCVFVGENNSGKTAIIDALRLMFFSAREFDVLRLNEDDFRSGTNYTPIEISCTFADLTEQDEVHFLECLVDIGGMFEVRINMRAEFNTTTQRVNSKFWGGETEGGSLPFNIYDRIATVYLQPLRDPETGLRAGRHSQVSRLIDRLTDSSRHSEFVSIANDANTRIKDLDSVREAKKVINDQMTSIAGNKLAQNTELIFSDPTFHRIIAGLLPEIESLPFELNGLGYNNLIFTAATLGTLRKSPQYSFRSILVEEPEAHLHPHLQTLFLSHLANVAADTRNNEVQVIVSSHSPILVSQAPIDSIVSVCNVDGKVSSVSVCTMQIADAMKKKLQRFLDATRGEMFFAQRLLMVEGIAEVLVVPLLAKIAGGSLKDSAVTVLNVEGLNFNAFLPLFGEGRLNFPTAILTDGDAPSVNGLPSPAATGLKDRESDISCLRVEIATRTFEHELARSSQLFPFMLDAFESLHPRKSRELRDACNAVTSYDQKADVFLGYLLDTKTSKGEFAQELATRLDASDMLEVEAVPTYIRNALQFLGVIN